MQSLDVLIVDDEPAFLDVIEGLLRSFGVTRVTRAGSGDEARGILRTPGCAVNCVLSDIAMDHGSGLELLQAVRDGRERLAAPATFVLFTGLESEDVRSAARRMGADGFLTKPVTPERLRDAIHPGRMRDVFQPLKPMFDG